MSLIDWLKRNVSWDRTSGIVGLIAGVLGLGWLSLGRYRLAEVCFIIAAVLILVWVLVLRRHVLIRIPIAVAALVILLVFLGDIESARYQAMLKEVPARLVAADQHGGTGICSADGLTVILGNMVFGSRSLPYSPIQVLGKPLITFTKSDDGGLDVTLDVHGKDDTLLARITRNLMTLGYTTFPYKRMDLYTFHVYDSTGKEVLFVYYLNPHVMRITGDFYANGRHVVISDHSLVLNAPGGQQSTRPSVTLKNFAICGILDIEKGIILSRAQ